MTRENKVSSYQKIYETLKKDANITNLSYPDASERTNYDFFCDIKDIHVEYSLRASADLLVIKATKMIPDATDEQLTRIGNDMVKGHDFNFTAYDGKIIFQLTFPFIGTADDVAAEEIYNKALSFINTLATEIASKDAKPAPKITSKPAGQDRPVRTPDDPRKAQRPERLGRNNGNNVSAPGKAPATQASRNETANRAAAENHQQVRPDGRPERTAAAMNPAPAGNDADVYDVSDILATIGMAPGQAEKPEKKGSRPNTEQKPSTATPAPQPKKEDQAFGKKDRQDRNNKRDQARDRERNGNVDRKPAGRAQEPAAAPKNPWDNAPKDAMPDMSASNNPELDYVKTMYMEMEKVFDSRKQQLDFREDTLNKRSRKLNAEKDAFKNKMSKAEAELQQKYEDKEKELHKEIETQRAALKKENEDLESKRYEIKIATDKLKMEQGMLSTRMKAIDEREAFIEEMAAEKAGSAYTAQAVDPAVMEENESLRAKVKEFQGLLSDKQAQVDSLQASVDELSMLKEQLENAQGSSEDATAPFKEAVRQLTEKLNDANAKIKELSSHAEASDEVLAYQDTLMEENEKLKNDLAAYGSTVEEYEALKEEYAKLSEAKDPRNIAASIQNTLRRAGVPMELMEQNNETILAGEQDGCVICINIGVGMVYIEKAVKKASKYVKDIDQWNQADIRQSYMYTDKKIVCKRVYADAAADTLDSLRKLRDLR